MKIGRIGLILLGVVLIGIAAWWFLGAPAKVTITREELQREVEKRFPIEKSELLFTVRLSEPRVLLKPNSDRIGIGVSISVSGPVIKAISGKGELDGRVRFDPEARELFLESAELRLSEASGVSEKDLRTAEVVVRPLLSGLLARVPIYRLKETDLRFPGTNAQVKEMRVEEGRVILRFAR